MPPKCLGSEIECQGLFVAVGMEPQTELLKGFVTLDKTGYVVADETGKTSVDGFFVAGDVRAKALRQVFLAQKCAEAVGDHQIILHQ